MFDTSEFIEESIASLRNTIDDVAIIACSGGVDSTVAAVIANQAVGDLLHCVYVDTGFMRKGETEDIEALLAAQGIKNLVTVKAADRYFKALEGDRQMGVNSLPVTLGPERAARVACWIMALPQAIVIALLIAWDKPFYALAIAVLLAAQVWAMTVLLSNPKARAPWYNGSGVTMYVSGMMIAAFALRTLL